MSAFTGSPVSAHQMAHDVASEESRGGRLYFGETFYYVHAAGTGTGEINLCQLPPGSWTLVALQSGLLCDQLSAGATIALGVRPTTADENPAAFLPAADAASAAIALTDVDALGGDDVAVVSTENIGIYATIASGNITNTKVIAGTIVYTRT